MIQGSLPRKVSMLMLILLVAACGGGSGGPDDATILGAGDTGSSGTTPTPVIVLSLRAADGVTDITRVDGTETGRLIAQVLDAEGGSPVSGVVVTFTVDSVGQITPDNGTALSDASGFSEVSLGAGTTEGAGNVSASATVNGSAIRSNVVGFATDGLGSGVGSGSGSVIVLSLRAADGVTDITRVDGTETGRLIAQVLDAEGGSPVSGVVVTFTVDSVGQITPDSGTALSDASGIAEVSLGAGTTEGAGNVSASATVNALAIRSNVVGFATDGLGSTVNFLLQPILLTTPNGSLTVSRDNEGTVSVTVTNGDGTTLTQNTLVEFETTLGTLTESAVFATNGVATTTLRAGLVSGSGNVSAVITIGTEVLNADPVVFISAGDSIAAVVLSVPGGASPSARASTPVDDNVDAANPVVVTATVTDSLGVLSQGSVVQFSLTGNGRLSKTSDITNISGVATTTLFAGTREGFGQISATATVDGVSIATDNSNQVTFVTDGDEPFTGEGNSNLTIVIGLDTNGDQADTGENAIDADLPGVLFALVTQADGSPIAGMVVRFSLNGGVGDLFPLNGLALTDDNGLASAALTAGSVPGAGSATATIIIGGATFNEVSLTFSSLGNAGDAVIVVTLTFNDATPGNGSNIITTSEPATILILVEDASGANLPNRTAIVTTTLGTVSISSSTPASTATAITDSNGGITVDLAAGSTFGTGTISVTVGDTSAVELFDVGVDGLEIGTCSGGTSATDCSVGTTFTAGVLNVSTTPLSAGGTSTISLVVVDSSQVVVPNVDISFTTVCAGKDPAEASISATVTSNSSGVVTATYLATGCVGIDIVTATEASAGLTAKSPDNLTDGGLEVLTATIGSIRFDSVTPQNIQIKGTGTSSAIVVFQVLNVQGNPVEDATVTFELTTNVGGLSLVSASGLTDVNGNAAATVNAGLIPTTVRVRARVAVDGNSDGDTDDPEDFILETLSDGLSVNTGVPDQNSMSISASILNIEGEGFDGDKTSINLLLADAFNNPVPDGTTIQFRTEYGAIESSCKTIDGLCSVTLTSQEPRRPLDPNTLVQTLEDNSCPTAVIIDETVTISVTASTDGITDYVPSRINRVEVAATDVQLTEGTTDDYTVNSDGIECVAGSALCTNTVVLQISYERMYLDEVGNPSGTADGNNPTNPAITNPGVGTAPFYQITGVPCLAAVRSASLEASEYRSGLGQLYGGRSTVFVFAQGEESFIDTNGNGQYDFNEPFVDLTEAFHDLNEDNVFGNGTPSEDDSRSTSVPNCYGPESPLTSIPTPDKCFQIGGEEETFVDFGDNDSTNVLKDLDGQFNAGNGIYNGTLCPDAVSQRTATCNNGSVPCLESTHRYCTRDLVNIRRDIVILFSGSEVYAGLRDVATGEYISEVHIRGGSSDVVSGEFDAGVVVVRNDGTDVTIRDDFTIGYADTQVAPGIGEIVALRSGSGSVFLDISDQFNGRHSTGTTVSVAQGDGGCEIQNSPGTSLSDSNGLPGVVTIGISLGSVTTPTSGSAPITIRVTTNKGLSEFAFNCSY